jgi:2-keto-4-pentenoate hydratase/2-oxohepta-3-ene-1,7-dioic acid hydratase in catechol pathway
MNSIKIDSANFTPSKIVCVGRNYLEHIQELDNETPEERRARRRAVTLRG